MDRARFPRVDAYLRALPEGLESYPRCAMKGSILLSFLDGLGPVEPSAGLPHPVSELLAYPPLASDWIPAVLARSAWLAVADHHFPGDDRRALEWSVYANARLAGSAMYSGLIGYVPPALVLRGAGLRLQAIYRGMTLTVSTVGSTSGLGVIGYPPHLMPRLSAEVTASGLGIALGKAHCRNATVELASWSPTEATLSARWEDAS